MHTPEVVVLLAEGFEEIEAITVIDTLRRAGIDTLVAAVGAGLSVMGGHGISVTADRLLDEVTTLKPKMVVLPGGGKGVQNIAASKAARTLTGAASEIAAICAAPSALAEWQLLHGRRATAYPGFEQALSKGGAIFATANVVEDKNLTTSRGPGTALEFALALVQKLRGTETRNTIAEQMLVPQLKSQD